jgi:hypothetical protein
MRTIKATLLVLAVMIAVVPAAAQDAPPLPGELVLDAVSAPRGVAFDAEGNLLVAVAGTGGEHIIEIPSFEDPAVMMQISAGLSGKVVSVAADGTSSDLLSGLPSYATPQETTGIYRVIPNGDSLWLVQSSSNPGAFWGSSVVELDAETLMTKNVINMTGYEVANNPDGNEIDSNVSDIAWTADGTMLITDAGANTLYSWTADAGLAVVQSWSENSVPTSVEVAENGDVYVGFLGEGIAPGAAKIERWSNGELAETFSGLNAVTDILLDGDTLYAVQLVIFGEEGPGAGSVVTVTADGATPVAEGLLAPFAIAKGPDGALYVSFGTIAFFPDAPAGVVKIEAAS